MKDLRISLGAGSQIAAEFPPGAVRLPGFVDPHLHLLAMAAQRLSVDCSIEVAPTIKDIVDRIRARAQTLAIGTWVRAEGYEEIHLKERRHPSRADLDAAAPDHPVLLHHRAGSVVVANTCALRELGLDVREGSTTQAEVLIGVESFLNDRVPLLDHDEMVRALGSVSEELAEAGVTECTDATATNGLDRYALLCQLAADGVIRQRLVVMPGIDHLGDFVEAGLTYGCGDGRVRVGHVKLVPPGLVDAALLREQVRSAHEVGWPVAVHVVGIDQLDAALGAMKASPAPTGTRDRLEHNALCLPEQVRHIAKSGAAVVTQPSFLVHRSRRYVEELSPVEHDWLYRVGSLLGAGVTVAGSSDAPVVPARPLEVAMAAMFRGGDDFATPGFAPDERVDGTAALALITSAAAEVGPRWLDEKGHPDSGGDSTVLSVNPFENGVSAEAAGAARVLATFVAGRMVFGP